MRRRIRRRVSSKQEAVLEELVDNLAMTIEERHLATQSALRLVSLLRRDDTPSLMESFLAEYGLSSDEGVALMCLAEALLRVPDIETMDDLILDKLVQSTWNKHLGKSSSTLVNMATWGLLFTGEILNDAQHNGLVRSLRGVVKRLGQPVVRAAVRQAMKFMGQQFVLGESIDSAFARGQKQVDQGYTYSFDMLGEAAITQKDAQKYYQSYKRAIDSLVAKASSNEIVDNPGISIKLSALHPRYEFTQRARVVDELVPIVVKLAQRAMEGNIGLNIDAEEAERLDISLDIIQAVFEDPSLETWDGFGVVVQAYNKCASAVLDWVYALAQENNRRVMVRLVKGAYWDTEIKRAQVEGLRGFPVFTQKAATDISYLCCAKKLLSMGDKVYPQFATHNAHTIAAILAMAKDNRDYEFQRLHGMGERVFQLIREQHSARCRIYAPVGKHKDLLAYLVRRLLENGANSSFVNQVVDPSTPVQEVVADPFEKYSFEEGSAKENEQPIKQPSQLFYPTRTNSKGWDLRDHFDVSKFNQARGLYSTVKWRATPLISATYVGSNIVRIVNPSDANDVVGEVVESKESDAVSAIEAAKSWTGLDAHGRSNVLLKVATMFEQNSGELFAILCREAGKTPTDVVAEVREAVDFLRYYASQAKLYSGSARGVFVCISPWNFPLAIFTGQICAALAAGNGVLAKPAEATPLVAFFAVKLFHQAGVPLEVLQLLPGQGASIGELLVSSRKVNGVCFTGSTATGLRINRRVAENMAPDTPLIAETGGLNAMVVDSSALPEQAVKDIIRSAFQSAGQRCSALRLLYIQEDIYTDVLEMLFGAIDELNVGAPWKLSTDLGPLISDDAYSAVQSYLDKVAQQGRLMKSAHHGVLATGHFVAPSVVSVNGVHEMQEEVFGPVLHVAKFKADALGQVIEDLNSSGYGLTFGLHTRIDSRVEYITSRLNVGNVYVNRDQVGAVVGSQPFGGENLSGTGPKAGGPRYLPRFIKSEHYIRRVTLSGPTVDLNEVQTILNSMRDARVLLSEEELPGPTGELNKLSEYGRGVVLCLGGDPESAVEQAKTVKENGCQPLIICPGASGQNAIDGFLAREMLARLNGFSAVVLWSNSDDASLTRQSLASREGRIIPFICDSNLADVCRLERHLCVDTTAAGGNTSLLSL